MAVDTKERVPEAQAATPAATAPDSSSGLSGWLKSGFTSVANAATSGAEALVEKSLGTLPPDKFIGVLAYKIKSGNPSPELAAETDKLSKTLTNNPALTKSIQAAMANDPSMLEEFKKQGAGSDAVAQLKDINASLADKKNHGKIIGLMNKIAEKPDDEFNYAYFKRVTENSKKVLSGKATKEDKDALSQDLGAAGLKDSGLELMRTMEEDPMAFLDMLKNRPEELKQMLVDQLGDMPPYARNMAAGGISMMIDLASGFMDDSMGGHYVKLGKQIGASIEKTGKRYTPNELAAQHAEAGTGEKEFDRSIAVGSKPELKNGEPPKNVITGKFGPASDGETPAEKPQRDAALDNKSGGYVWDRAAAAAPSI